MVSKPLAVQLCQRYEVCQRHKVAWGFRSEQEQVGNIRDWKLF